MAKLTITHDFMQHFKFMKTASPENRMQAICDKNNKMFLSIDNDGKLRITSDENMKIPEKANQEVLAENCGSTTGWMQKDLSEEIRLQAGDGSNVKNFSIGESQVNGKYILCAIVSSKNKEKDFVFYSLSESISSPQWVKVNLPEKIAHLPIVDIRVEGFGKDLCIALYAQAKNNRLEQYFLRSSEADFNQWDFAPLAVDFDQIDSSVIGHPKGKVQGSYTLGKIQNETQVLFTPYYNIYSPVDAPLVSLLALPKAAGAKESSMPDRLATFIGSDGKGASDLFACGNGVLSIYPYNNQKNKAEPTVLTLSEHFTVVKQLFAIESKGRVYVWLLNASKELCYLYADLNKRNDPNAWSVVMLLCDDLDYVHMFKEDNSNAFYAYTNEGTGILGYEDDDSSLWSYTDVFTSSNEGKSVPIRAYITHIKTEKPAETISLKTSANGLFEINSRIYSLNKGDMIRVKSNPMGVINIIQLTELFYAIEFEVKSDSTTITVKPSETTEKKLLSLNSVGKLQNATIQRIDSPEPQPLVPKDTNPDDLYAVASAISSLATKNAQINGANDVIPHDIVHLRCYGTRIEAVPTAETDLFLRASLDYGTEYSSEDVFAYMRSLRSPHSEMMASNGFFDIIIDTVSSICRFIVKTAKKIIHFVIDTTKKVLSTVKEILVLIVTDPKKILDFLKYVFDFKDILLTQQYMKVLVNSKIDGFAVLIDNAKKSTDKALSEAEKKIAEWGGLDLSKLSTDTPANMQSKYSNSSSDGDVHTNYFTTLVTDNAKHADAAFQASMTDDLQSNDTLSDLLEKLKAFAQSESETIKEIVDEVGIVFTHLNVNQSLDIADIFKKLLAIMAKGVISSVKGAADLMFDIAKILLISVKKMINAGYEIPCVSDFLKTFGMKEISLLDVVLFVPAFFSTITYKLITGKAPIVKKDIEQLKIQSESTSFALQSFLNDENNTDKKKDVWLDLAVGSSIIFAGMLSFAYLSDAAVAITVVMKLIVLVLGIANTETQSIVLFYIIYFALTLALIWLTIPEFAILRELLKPFISYLLIIVNTFLFAYGTYRYVIDSFPAKGLSSLLGNIQAVVGNFVTASELEKVEPRAAEILHLCEFSLALVSGGILNWSTVSFQEQNILAPSVEADSLAPGLA